MRRRTPVVAALAEGSEISTPSNSIRPRDGAYRPTMRRAMVDFPQPDSPTSASVSPLRTANDTSSTACSSCRGTPSMTRLSHGRDTSKSRPTFSSRSSSALLIEPAGGEIGAHRAQLGTLDPAAVETPVAARIERAARGDRVQARHRAVYLHQRGAPPVGGNPDFWYRAHQPGGIGVPRRAKHFAHRADLPDAARIHHCHAVRRFGDHAH